jgi:pyridine nucleotide transhydrogenase-like protein
MERDAGASYAAHVGDQRHLLRHRRGRAARTRLERLARRNIFGGFLVTQRMLGMYKKKGK